MTTVPQSLDARQPGMVADVPDLRCPESRRPIYTVKVHA